MRKSDIGKAGAYWRCVPGLLMFLLVVAAGCSKARPDPGSAPAFATESRFALATLTPEGAGLPPPSRSAPTSTPNRPTSTSDTTGSPTARPAAMTTVVPSPSPGITPPTPALGSLRLGLEPVVDGLDRPVFVTHAGDGSRLYIVEKGGTIRLLANGQPVPRPFLDIRDRVLSRGSEQGLLGLAFPPDFGRTGVLFVNYTGLSGDTVVSRFSVTGDPDLADPASEFQVLGIDQPAANHNGGNLVFGPDGYLWIGTGDGGGANDRYGNGQAPQTLLGKMLRLDVMSDPRQAYTIPPDNPWVNAEWNGQDVRDEIWAVGLRNPWRYSFDRETGDLWIADVGQNEYEEIDVVRSGAGGRIEGGLNFGWPIMEGLHCFPDSATCVRDGLVAPVMEYQHGEDGCSVTGGYVYRGAAIPALAGAYVYGDYCSGRIWALTQGAGDVWQVLLLLESGLSISSFGEDESGELYVADLQGGTVHRLVESR